MQGFVLISAMTGSCVFSDPTVLRVCFSDFRVSEESDQLSPYILLAVALQSYYSSNAPIFQESKKILDHSDFFLISSIW